MAKRTIEIGVAVVVAVGVIALFFVYGNPINMSQDNDILSGAAANSGDTQPQQLVAQDEHVGTGDTAVAGDTIIVNYTGRLQNGTVFDTSIGKPAAPTCPDGTKEGFCFQLGTGQVIAGWDQGVQGMKVGGKRLLVVPAALAYGSEDYGPIPGNSTLVFEVTLLKVVKGQ